MALDIPRRLFPIRRSFVSLYIISHIFATQNYIQYTKYTFLCTYFQLNFYKLFFTQLDNFDIFTPLIVSYFKTFLISYGFILTVSIKPFTSNMLSIDFQVNIEKGTIDFVQHIRGGSDRLPNIFYYQITEFQQKQYYVQYSDFYQGIKQITIKVFGMIKMMTVWMCLLIWCNCQLLRQRLGIIASLGDNYIIRGNLPIHNNQFQGEILKQSLKELTGVKRFKLVCVSLLNFLTSKETRNRYIEQKYFQNNPSYGKYRNHYVLGSIIGASDIPSSIVPLFSLLYHKLSIDSLDTILDQLKSYLTSTQPIIVFVHCSAGIDRTGLISGSYQMKYLNKSFKEVYNQNLLFLQGNQRKDMHFNCYNGLQWYCIHLRNNMSECGIN